MERIDELLDEGGAIAAGSETASIPCDDFLDILDMAARTRAFDTLGLNRLQEMCDSDEIHLSSDELRLLLMLAGQAKRRNLKPRLRVVQGTA